MGQCKLRRSLRNYSIRRKRPGSFLSHRVFPHSYQRTRTPCYRWVSRKTGIVFLSIPFDGTDRTFRQGSKTDKNLKVYIN